MATYDKKKIVLNIWNTFGIVFSVSLETLLLKSNRISTYSEYDFWLLFKNFSSEHIKKYFLPKYSVKAVFILKK